MPGQPVWGEGEKLETWVSWETAGPTSQAQPHPQTLPPEAWHHSAKPLRGLGKSQRRARWRGALLGGWGEGRGEPGTPARGQPPECSTEATHFPCPPVPRPQRPP